MKKRILLLIDDLEQGGAERQMVYLAHELKKCSYDIRLVKFFSGVSAYDNFLRLNNIKVETIVEGTNRWKRVLVIKNLVKSWTPDVVITYKDGVCMSACIARLLCKFNLIVSERNTTQELSFYERLKFLLYNAATFIVPNSYSQGEFIDRHYPRLRDKVKVITNTLDFFKFTRAKTDNELRVITVARLAPQKNVLTFLKALSILKDRGVKASFVWFGKISSDEYYKEIVELQIKLGLDSYIKFYTEGSDEIENEYSKSTHFCLPSIYEGFPNVLCEAMASGLICTASDVCDNRNILDNQEFLFDPTSPENIAEKIIHSLLISPEERNKIAERNSDRIKELCSAERFIKEYTTLIQNI